MTQDETRIAELHNSFEQGHGCMSGYPLTNWIKPRLNGLKYGIKMLVTTNNKQVLMEAAKYLNETESNPPYAIGYEPFLSCHAMIVEFRNEVEAAMFKLAYGADMTMTGRPLP